jgi:hypothetical protein
MLMILVIFTGPISLLMTTKLFWDFTRRNTAVWIIRRMLVATISALGLCVEMFFILGQLPLAPKLFAIAGFALNIIALKREFLRNKPWGLIFKSSAHDPNGPAGQS